MDDWVEVNRANWEERVPAHAASVDYAVERFVEDPDFISDVVRFDLPRLGDLHGLRGVHLQCHIGTDTLSLARLGAQMSGLDFSPAALEQARALARRLGIDASFVEAEVYDALSVLEAGSFDFLYTGIGALCWLPRIKPWAEVVAGLLRPGGWLLLREGHPMLWTLSDAPTGPLAVEYPYFEREEPLVWEEEGTYVETDMQFEHNVSHSWNHGLGEVVTALLEVGFELTMLIEHDSVPWEALPGRMERTELSEWRLAEAPWRLPHTYTLRAVKRD
jgi:SAM-dependent methyltransferase